MYTKRGFVFILSAFLLVSSLRIVLAEDPPGFDQLPLINETQSLHQTFDEQKWDYLGTEWKHYFLNQTTHPYIYATNHFLNQTSPVFFVFTGSSYDFSWNFFVSLIIWLLVFLTFADAIILFSLLSTWVSICVALIFSSISGHLGIYRAVTPFLFKFFFFKEGVWKWLGPMGFVLFCFIVLLLLDRLFKRIQRLRANSIRQQAAQIQQQNQGILQNFLNNLVRGQGASP